MRILELKILNLHLQLHEQIEIVYTVDGIEATFYIKDGSVAIAQAVDKDIEGALFQLEGRMQKKGFRG